MISNTSQSFNMFALKGKVQNYAWGGKKYISTLLNNKISNVKTAEYWLGTHIKAPSVIKTAQGNRSLREYLKSNLKKCLSKKTADTYGKLPFLFKVLDVNKMLSIQVHPSKIEAEKGFKHENDLGIPLTAVNRNYKDDNHKPEIMVALSEFWLLHGFLSKEKLMEILKNIPEFADLITVFEKQGYFGLYKSVMEKSKEETNKMLAPLIERIMPLYKSDKLEKSTPDYWAAKAVETSLDKSNLDKGIFSIYFFNIVKANKGEAVFQKAGMPHAYLEGQNIELMANSDNVLRGGLTQKHVDVPELLKHVLFEETIPNILLGDLQEDGLERVYATEAKDFELSKIDLSVEKTYKSEAKTVEILIVIGGEVAILEEKSSLYLKKGESVFFKAGSKYKIKTKDTAVIYKAKVPQ
ncbi:mannose-6-phosphate isomerase, class I [uncultured Tenacibaculum sp.]|uniref:mannose-6-phosphate isomerase, class I n=1 Tax=uncultured Tenacibaculum sp. TaxID=174713 RepID=UPI002630EB81|nr:mannose-6-phosphate isomerase, class I [uncultured Tenacibaculum sp.]